MEMEMLPLTPCIDCGNQVSRSAVACPSCGRPAHLLAGAPLALSTNWFGEIMVGLLILVTLFTAPAMWPLLLLLVVLGAVHVIRKAPGLLPSRYPGKHLARRPGQPQLPLSMASLRHALARWLGRVGRGAPAR